MDDQQVCRAGLPDGRATPQINLCTALERHRADAPQSLLRRTGRCSPPGEPCPVRERSGDKADRARGSDRLRRD